MRKLLLLLCLIVSVTQLSAQNRTITGRITDANGNPVQNASILIKGTRSGTTTGADGTFTLTAPANTKTLVISSVGFKPTEVAADRGPISLNLAAASSEIEEVVVTGYTREKKSSFSGAVSVISAKSIETVPMGSFDQVLQGRTPGLLINSGSGQPGANARVVIRGVQSIAAAFAQPLFIIDGIPVEAGVFQSMNANDFESVTVLKDASASAMYGSRAAAGVIVITTKRGKTGSTNFAFRTQLGFNTVLQPTNFQMMNSAAKLLHEENNKYGPGWTYSSKNPTYAGLSATAQARNNFILDSLRNNNVNFKDLLFRTGQSQSHEINVSGGADKTRFFVSAAYFSQQGTDLNSKLDRYTTRFNMDHATDRFTFSMTNMIGVSVSRFSEGDFVGNSARNPFQISWRAMPYENPFNPDGSLIFGTTTSTVPKYIGNTLEAIANTTGRQNQLKMNSGINLSYELFPHLTARTTFGIDMRNDRWLRYINPASQVGTQQLYNKGLNSEANYVSAQLISTSGIGYSNTIAKKHELEASAWFEVLRNWQRALGLTVYGLDPRLTETGQGAGTSVNGFPPVASSAKSGAGIRSFFGLMRYTYDQRYTLNASIRRDGTSRILNRDNREIVSWSVGGSWNAMREDFFKDQRVLSDLKVRVSYGLTPNLSSISTSTYGIPLAPLVSVTNYQGPQSPSFGTATYAGSPITGIVPTSPGNPNLRIENVAKFNFGVDFSLWNNRAQFTVDVYKNKTKDLFVNQPLPRETGFNNQNINAGIMTNKGMELSVNIELIKSRDITWNIGGNHSINHNKIEDLGLVEQYESGTFLIKKGLPYGTHYTYSYLGADPATGLPVYETLAGGLTTDLAKAGRFTKFGNFTPVQFGGFNTYFRVKSVSLSTLFSYQFDVRRSNNILSWVARATNGYAGAVNQLSYINETQWLKPGDALAYPAAPYDRDFTSSDIQNASFIRLRNITLSYQLSSTVTNKLKFIKTARFYVQGQNVFVWSPWEGLDPEDDNNISLNEYPSSRMIVLGLDLNF